MSNSLKLTMKITGLKSHDYYPEVSTHCSEEWTTIMSLEQKAVLTDEENETLVGLKNRFTLVFCADYQN